MANLLKTILGKMSVRLACTIRPFPSVMVSILIINSTVNNTDNVFTNPNSLQQFRLILLRITIVAYTLYSGLLSTFMMWLLLHSALHSQTTMTFSFSGWFHFVLFCVGTTSGIMLKYLHWRCNWSVQFNFSSILNRGSLCHFY